MDRKEPKPCPFCCSLIVTYSDDDYLATCRCPEPHVEGHAKTINEAIEDWWKNWLQLCAELNEWRARGRPANTEEQ